MFFPVLIMMIFMKNQSVIFVIIIYYHNYSFKHLTRLSVYTKAFRDDISLTLRTSTSCRNLPETDIKASWGHSWNQSITVPLTMAGNLRDLIRRVDPTGEKHSTIFNCRRTYKFPVIKKLFKRNVHSKLSIV
jgi:hypothetical protein